MFLSKLIESYYTQKDFDKYVEMNKNSILSRSNNEDKIGHAVNSKSEPNAMYWVSVKNKDVDTIATAFVSGIIDFVDRQKRSILVNDENKRTDLSAEELATEGFYFKQLNDSCKKYVIALLKILPDNFKKLTKRQTLECINIIEILNKIDSNVRSFKELMLSFRSSFAKKQIKLYRGLALPTNYFIDLYNETNDIRTLYSPAKLLKNFDNTQKPYNSFSTNIAVAKRYASNTFKNIYEYSINDYTPSVITSGIATRDMINYALTAYLTGLYLTSSGNEELNISNKAVLKDFKIEEYNNEFKYMIEFIKQIHKRKGEFEDFIFNYLTDVPLIVDLRNGDLIKLNNAHLFDDVKKIIKPTEFMSDYYLDDLGSDEDYVFGVQFNDGTYNLLSLVDGDFYFKHNSKELPFCDPKEYNFKTVEGESAKIRYFG